MVLITTPGWYLLGFDGSSNSIKHQLNGRLRNGLTLLSAYAMLPEIEINRLLGPPPLPPIHNATQLAGSTAWLQPPGATHTSRDQPFASDGIHWTLEAEANDTTPSKALLQDRFGSLTTASDLLYVKIENLGSMLNAPIGLWCYIGPALE